MPRLQTSHHTFVHHIALDPSGTLLASCSSDKTVEVFHRNTLPGEGDVWERGCTMSDHSGPVLRLAWCQHREHGPLLASAGADRWIYIYRITISSHEGRTLLHPVRWSPVRGYEKDIITDVAFVPPQQYHVLLLSTASLDGCVRLYEVHQPLQFPCVCKITPEIDAMEEAADSSQSIARRELLISGGSAGGGGSGNSVPPGSPVAGGGSAGSSVGGWQSVSAAAAAAAGAGGSSGGSGGGGVPSTALRTGGVTSIAWFPGAAERTMTLAVGTVSGRFFLYRYMKEMNTFCNIPISKDIGSICCISPILDLQWAPSVGRRFHLIAVCSRSEVFILRLNCVSPSLEERYSFELFRFPAGAVSASWSRSATLLYLTSDDRHTQVTVLQMVDPLEHQSWQVVSHHAAE